MYNQLFGRSVSFGAALLLVIASTVSMAQTSNLCVNPRGRGGCFASIQAAVDAAVDGDQIIIRPGKYKEQVTIIDKDLSLIGRDGAVVQAPADMQQTLLDTAGSTGRPIIGVANAEVTIRGLIVDGLDSAEANPFLEGITFMNASGEIRNNRVRNVGFGAPTLPIDNTTGEPLYQGDSIVVINALATPRTITIAENRIVNYNDIGIVVGSFADPNDPTVANLTVHMLENLVVGLGTTDVIDQWGILMFSEGFEDPQLFVTGTIRDNRVRHLASVDPHPLPAVGIETNRLYNVTISDNVVEDTNIGLDGLRLFNGLIVKNRFIGPQAEAAGSNGLFLSGSDNQVNDNHFRRLNAAILLSIGDEFLGSALNTVINDNHFENVPVDVLTGPGSAAINDKEARISSRVQRYHTVVPSESVPSQ